MIRSVAARTFFAPHSRHRTNQSPASGSGGISSGDSQFGAERKIEITLEKPYRKEPPPRLNSFGTPAKLRYRTGDVCAILRVSPDLLRWRFMTGKYSEVGRDGWGRIFTLEDVKRLISQTRNLSDPHEVKRLRPRR